MHFSSLHILSGRKPTYFSAGCFYPEMSPLDDAGVLLKLNIWSCQPWVLVPFIRYFAIKFVGIVVKLGGA